MRARFLHFLLLMLVCWESAGADGPHITFHETQGPYTVTLFSTPDPLVAGPVELSLLVQNTSDGTLASPRSSSGKLALPGRPAVAFALKPGAGGNPRLPGATVALPQAGSYALTLEVAGARVPAVRFRGILPIASNTGKRDTVLWAVFIPSVLAFLFLANQYGKQKLQDARFRSRTVRG